MRPMPRFSGHIISISTEIVDLKNIIKNKFEYRTNSIKIHVVSVCKKLLFASYLLQLKHRKLCIYKEELEDTKGVIRIRKSKKNRQHIAQKKKDKRTNNDLQNIHIKQKIE